MKSINIIQYTTTFIYILVNMGDFIFVIDGYLSNYERVSVCDELIIQLKKNFPEQKILLLNKFSNSYGLESKVDYYFYYGDGFMLGQPPEEIIKDKRYCRPYVYFQVSAGTLENWMPDVGVSDHAANVYNGFVISSKIANSLGFEKVFRIEYDMLFDNNEINILKEHLKKFKDEDYLIYGRRKEGGWAADYLSLIDLHFCGFSTKLLDGFDIVRSDSDYWGLCEKIKYWGKWAEYLMSMAFNKNITDCTGSEHPGWVRDFFPKSYFDRVSSSGLWEDKWIDMPKFCKISRDNGQTELDDEILLFYWNENSEFMEFDVSTNFGYKKQGTLPKKAWFFETIKLDEEKKDLEFNCIIKRDDGVHEFKQTINKTNIAKLTNRFLSR